MSIEHIYSINAYCLATLAFKFAARKRPIMQQNIKKKKLDIILVNLKLKKRNLQQQTLLTNNIQIGRLPGLPNVVLGRARIPARLIRGHIVQSQDLPVVSDCDSIAIVLQQEIIRIYNVTELFTVNKKAITIRFVHHRLS